MAKNLPAVRQGRGGCCPLLRRNLSAAAGAVFAAGAVLVVAAPVVVDGAGRP